MTYRTCRNRNIHAHKWNGTKGIAKLPIYCKHHAQTPDTYLFLKTLDHSRQEIGRLALGFFVTIGQNLSHGRKYLQIHNFGLKGSAQDNTNILP